MKTKNVSFKKAALPVFGILIAAIIALTSVTYAWFTSGTTATVSPINVGVEAAGGLQIAMGSDTNFNWMSALTVEEASGYTLSPSSTNGTATGNAGARTLNFFSARYTDTYDAISDIAVAAAPDETDANADGKKDKTAGYITFDLYFRNPELTAKNVNLDGTTVTSLAGQSNEAVRIAFVKQAKISSASSTQNNSAFASGTTFSDAATIFEPNSTSHTDKGLTDWANNKNNAQQQPGVKYGYKGIQAADATGNMFDRFTGYQYAKVTATEAGRAVDAQSNLVYDDNKTFEDYKVFDSTKTNGAKFTTWDIKNDFTGISIEEAADLFAQGRKVYIDNGDGTYTLNEAAIDNTGNTKYCLFTPVDLYAETTDATVLTATDVATTDIKNGENLVTYFTLDAQSVTKVTIYIWLEGQDVDCNNAVAGYQFDVNLSFSAVAAQA